MPYQNILFEQEEETAFVIINRPDKLNALNKKTLDELENVFEKIAEDESVKGVILTGEGDKAFVAGADISEFTGLSEENAAKLAKRGQDIFFKIETFKKPVIAAVNGYALGGGCELAMACHMRVASDKSSFGQPEVNLGLIPGYGGTQRLSELVGKSRAFELITTAAIINAETAYTIGLVNYVTMPVDMKGKCKEILRNIYKKSPKAVENAINSVFQNKGTRAERFDKEIEHFAKCTMTDDFKEGVAAFLEKRKPEFTGS